MDDSPKFSFSGGSPENNQLPPRKRHRSFSLKDDNDITVESSPPKPQQFAVPKDVTEGSASRTITAWGKLHEINLLNKILEYYNQNGTYPFDDLTHMQHFYKSWIEREAYVDEDVFNNKMVELPERFFKNQEKSYVFGSNLKAWMPPADVRIYELSNMIWGGNDDIDDDDDDVHDDGSILDDPEVGDQEGDKGG